MSVVDASSQSGVKSKCYRKCGLFSAIAIIVAAFVLRDGMVSTRQNAAFISVKGLAEKVITADFAVWVIPIRSSGDDLDVVRGKVDGDTAKIVSYLKKHDVAEGAIELGTIRVYDKMAQKYYNENNKAKRFSAEQNIVVKSNDVLSIKKASQNVNELLNEGVVLSYDGYSSTYAPHYLFTKLNEIKPDMLSEAMKEAHKAAEHLLVSEGNKVGKIKRASQGMFSVYSREAAGSGAHIDQRAYSSIGNRYSTNEAYFMEKVIRVVATVDYYVE